MSRTSSNTIPVNSPEKEVTMEHFVLMESNLPTSQAIPLLNVELALTSTTTCEPSIETWLPKDHSVRIKLELAPGPSRKRSRSPSSPSYMNATTFSHGEPAASESPELNPKDLTARLEDIENEIIVLQLRVDDAEARQAEDHAQIQSILARLGMRVGSAAPRILWKNLNGDATKAFISRVSEGVSAQIEAISASDANSMWNILASIIKDVANDSFGVAIGTSKTHTTHRESWWLCEEVQSKVAKKQARFKELLTCQEGNLEERLRAQERYKLAKRYAKKAIARAKEKAYKDLYKKLDSKERSSIEAIHLIRSLIEKYRERQRDLHLAFIDLEKAYNSVPRDLIWKTLIDKGASRRYIKVIRDMYNGAKTQVRTIIGNTEFFPVEVGLHQGSAISPYLFALILDEEALEANGLRVSREKTEYLRCDFSNSEIAHNKEVEVCIGDKILQPNESFRYLRSMLHKSGRIDEDVAHRIKAASLKWRAATGVVCDRNVPLKLKGKFYRAAIRHAMLVELEVETIINKMREGQLRWFGHVRRRPRSAPVRRVEALVVDGMRRRDRPKLRWEDKMKLDMKEILLSMT
nr:hypothetical protein [Tanacetum cinerariifolium]